MDNAHSHPTNTPSAALPTRSQGLRNNHAATPPPTRQERLLRSRNARFPAKKISISGISTRFSELIKTKEGKDLSQTPSQRNQENTMHKKHLDCGSATHSTSSLGILEEITHSIGARSRTSQKRPPIPVFQDSLERALLDNSQWESPSLYHDASSLVGSPPGFDHIHDSLPTMGLREISGNARKTSEVESSPFPSSARSGRRGRSTQKARFDSEDYIEHIERELELVKDAVYSPNTNRPWKEKLKMAKAENERLRSEILDMKAAFEHEVQKTVEHMTNTEIELRRKIRSLEDELDQKDLAMHELECQHDEKRLDQSTVDTLKSTIERLEQEKLSLEQSNDGMSKRNEVLTQLLAISPTKSHHPHQLSSPIRRKIPRPRSLMIPRIPSSPGTMTSSRPQSIVASPAVSATCYFSPRQPADSLPPAYGEAVSTQMLGDVSVDSGLGDSCSLQSNSRVGSRRSTVASQVSLSPTCWGHPAATSQPTKRRARRFLPGSTQLKPLLLPALTGGNGNLTSPLTSPQRRQTRDFSEESLDPTTMFLSQSPVRCQADAESPPLAPNTLPLAEEVTEHQFQSFESVFEPPSDPLEMPESIASQTELPEWSPESISEQLERLQMLELESLRSPHSEYINTWMSSPQPDSTDDDVEKTILPLNQPQEPGVSSHTTSTGAQEGRDIGPLGRNSALARSPEHSGSVEVPQQLFSPSVRRGMARNVSRRRRRREPQQIPLSGGRAALGSLESLKPVSKSRKRRKISSSSLLLDTGEVFRLQTRSQENNFRLQLTAKEPETPSKPGPGNTVSCSSSRSSSLSPHSSHRTESPLEILQQGRMTHPLATVTIKTIYGTLSRYTTYIRDFKRDPLALVRRVIANAWHANWALMGKLSWWVLGLFLGVPRRNGQYVDWEQYDALAVVEREVGETSRLLNPITPTTGRRVRFEEQHESYRTGGSKSPARPALKKKRLGWGQSLLLWGKFSVAIMLAVGEAVVKGPAEMMGESDDRLSGSPRKRRPRVRLPCQDDHERFDSSSSPHSVPADFGLDDGDFVDMVENFEAPQFNFRRKDINSPPLSTRCLLQSDGPVDNQDLLSPLGNDSPLPAPYYFGRGSNETFAFDPPNGDQNCGDIERGDTLKPNTTNRASLDSLFDSPPPDGGREYDPESAGMFFSPLNGCWERVGG